MQLSVEDAMRIVMANWGDKAAIEKAFAANLTRASAATVAEPSKTATQGDEPMPKRGTLAWLVRLLQQLQAHGTASEAKVYINDPTFGRVEVGGALYGIADVELTPNDDDAEAAQQQQAEQKCGACDGTGLMQHASGDPQDAVNCPACAEQQAEPGADERRAFEAACRKLADMPEESFDTSWGDDELNAMWALWKEARAAQSGQRAGVAEDFLRICEDEAARAALVSLPLKLDFAKERGLRDVHAVHAWMVEAHRKFTTAVKALRAAAPTQQQEG